MKRFRLCALWMAVAVLLLTCCAFSGAARADEAETVLASGNIGGITWRILSRFDPINATVKRLVISGSGAIPDYALDSCNGKTLAPWFQIDEGKYLRGIEIGNGITRIGEYAFSPVRVAYCNTIDMVVIPDSVTEIGEGAFLNQDHLLKAKVPDSVKTLGKGAFSHKTTLVCSSGSAAFAFAQQNTYPNPVELTDLEVGLTLGPNHEKQATISRGEEIAYHVTCSAPGVTPTITTSPAGCLEVDTEKQVLRARTGENIYNGPTVTVTASAHGAQATCTVYIRKVYTVHLWEGEYEKDLGTVTYNEGSSYEPDYTLTRPGYVLRGWYTMKKIWQSSAGCFVLEFTRVTSVSDGDCELFCFWDKATAENAFANAVIAAIPDQTYTGKALKPAVTVTLNGKTLVKGTDYTLSYKNNKKPGEATVLIRGAGDYKGSEATATFRIAPAGTSISSLKNNAKKTVTVKWKKGKAGSGYQIQYSLKKNMKSAKSVTVKGLKTTSAKISKLKKGKTYYFRIRVFTTVNGSKLYSEWSSVKKIKVSK